MGSRHWLAASALTAVISAAGCHYDPYPWPRPGQPSATVLENQLNERDSLQDAANDLIAVAASAWDAVQRVYPAAKGSTRPGLPGGQYDCGPPFTFLTGSIYELPERWAPAPASAGDREAVVAAVADVLRAHHAEQVNVTPGRSASGELPREHGELRFNITTPVTPVPRDMVLSGATGCHHAAPGPGPWNTSATPPPTR